MRVFISITVARAFERCLTFTLSFKTLTLAYFFQVCRKTVTGDSCTLPFRYKRVRYDDCTPKDNNGVPWCYTDKPKHGDCDMTGGNVNYSTCLSYTTLGLITNCIRIIIKRLDDYMFQYRNNKSKRK